MSQAETVVIVSEEELYNKIERAVLAVPGVSHLTADGFQDIISGLGQAFGFKGRKGLLLRRSKKLGVKVDISLALYSGCRVNETARYIQMVIRSILVSSIEDNIYGIDVTVTDIVK